VRIAFLIGSLAGGGAERVAVRLAEAWTASGHDVTLLTWEGPEADVYEVPAGVERVHLRRGTGRSRRAALVSLPRLRSWLRAERPDVLVCFLPVNNLLGLLAARGTGIAVAVSERNAIELYRARWKRALLRAYRFTDAVVVQTRAASASLPPSVRRRSHVIVNPVPIHQAPDPVHREPLLLGVGRLVPEKRFDLLIESFAQIAGRHPGWCLTLLGEGPLRADLEARVRRLGLAERIALPGFAADVESWLGRASLYVLSSDVEGFPNTLVEAMASGCAVVATRCPHGPEEIVEDGVSGLLVPRGSAAGLARALDRLFIDVELRGRLSDAAQVRVADRYEAASVAAQWIDVFRSLGAADPDVRAGGRAGRGQRWSPR
jgi:GalNAc-alpha-(1->4)-GalNAc-alpha-(1->3)-diNAcBac-PP-undecaprenol alpha-1,4-N-acetyl-D-galactosaminyltransferase